MSNTFDSKDQSTKPEKVKTLSPKGDGKGVTKNLQSLVTGRNTWSNR